MCTVTIFPTKSGWLLTSSRDVSLARPKAKFPVFTKKNGIEILYPEDGLAKGTWIGTNNNATTVCLLNGAFEKHENIIPYRKSRGLIVLDILSTDKPYTVLKTSNLNGIEPFTLIMIENNKRLSENRWDGNKLHTRPLNLKDKNIWSSSTLYNDEVCKERKKMFGECNMTNDITEKELLSYHKTAFKELGEENQALMSRKEKGYGTVSITCLKASATHVSFFYEDVLNNFKKDELIQFSSSPILT